MSAAYQIFQPMSYAHLIPLRSSPDRILLAQSTTLCPRTKWYLSFAYGIFCSLAKVLSGFLVPSSNGTHRVQERLSCCSSIVAHRQFSGSYPFRPSILSKLFFNGRLPISARKLAKLAQRSHTQTPLPPYKWYFALAGFLQRACMLFHERYSRVKRMLKRSRFCRLKVLSNFFCLLFGPKRKHPQLLDWPRVSVYPKKDFSVPQSQRQFHRNAPCKEFSALLRTMSLPNLWPVRSRNGIGMSRILTRE